MTGGKRTVPFHRVNDIDIYYESGGDGPRLLYISGSGGDLRRGPRVLDGPLSEHFEILAYDQRGLGQTTGPDATYTMQQYADDAAGLLDVLEWESCRVVGVSFGGMVAQELAIRHPQRVERAVFACSSPGGAGGSSYPIQEYLDMSPEEAARRSLPMQDTRRDDDGGPHIRTTCGPPSTSGGRDWPRGPKMRRPRWVIVASSRRAGRTTRSTGYVRSSFPC